MDPYVDLRRFPNNNGTQKMFVFTIKGGGDVGDEGMGAVIDRD